MAPARRSRQAGLQIAKRWTCTSTHCSGLTRSDHDFSGRERIGTISASLGTTGRPLYRTTDAGRTWRPVTTTGKNDYWYDLAFTDRHVGEALLEDGGQTATVWRTTNACSTWSKIPQR